MKVRWRPEAQGDFERILDFIAERSPTGARTVTRRILQRTEQLRRLPLIGRTGRAAGFRELVVFGTPYIVVYRVQEMEIEITNIFHAAQNR